MCIFHKYVGVEDVDHTLCGHCFHNPFPDETVKYPKGYCPHSIRVCSKCGKFKGYGSHRKLSIIPRGCENQVVTMRLNNCR